MELVQLKTIEECGKRTMEYSTELPNLFPNHLKTILHKFGCVEVGQIIQTLFHPPKKGVLPDPSIVDGILIQYRNIPIAFFRNMNWNPDREYKYYLFFETNRFRSIVSKYVQSKVEYILLEHDVSRITAERYKERLMQRITVVGSLLAFAFAIAIVQINR